MIGSKTLLTTFFVIEGKGAYSLLLWRDWIHANCCIPSTMHPQLIQWVDDDIEVVQADDSVSVANVEPAFWEYQGIDCFSGKDWGEGPVEPVSSDQLMANWGEDSCRPTDWKKLTLETVTNQGRHLSARTCNQASGRN
jgi:hypothetical protein